MFCFLYIEMMLCRFYHFGCSVLAQIFSSVDYLCQLEFFFFSPPPPLEYTSTLMENQKGRKAWRIPLRARMLLYSLII